MSPVVKKVFDGLKGLKIGNTLLRIQEKGVGLSAEVVVRPTVAAKTTAAVVEKLLDLGIKKVSVEVRQ